MVLVNARTQEAIANDVALASTRADRRRGLLGRDGLGQSAALVLSPCWAIHTMFMRFPIDVIFVDREGRAVRIVRDLPPWRIAGAASAKSTIELPAGSLQLRDVQVGDTLRICTSFEGA
jgi:uncharacterized membrane protein (UPF0127 family)